MVSLDQTDAGGAADTRHDGGVIARGESSEDGRFEISGGRETGRFDRDLLGVLSSRRWRGRGAPLPSRNSRVGSASGLVMPKSPNDGPIARSRIEPLGRGLGPDDDAADHDVVARLDQTAGADVGEGGIEGRAEVVGLDQGDASAATEPAHDRGVGAGIEGGEDGRFEVVVRRETARDDFRFLGVAPVVVRHHRSAVGVVQLERGIGQRVGHAKIA